MRSSLTIATLLGVVLTGCNGAAGGPNGRPTSATAATTVVPSAAPGQLTPKTLNASTITAATPATEQSFTGGAATPTATSATTSGGGSNVIAGPATSQATNTVSANGASTTTFSGTPSSTVPALAGATAGTATPASVASVAVPALSGTLPAATSTTGSTTSTPTDPHLAYALNAINTSRATQNLPPYVLDPTMSSCALRHSQDCYNCCGGSESNFGSCAHKDVMAGDTCGGNAENQGVGGPGDQDQSFQQIHDGMMSEGPGGGHYDALMNTSYTTVGIGLYVDPNGILWVSEEFR